MGARLERGLQNKRESGIRHLLFPRREDSMPIIPSEFTTIALMSWLERGRVGIAAAKRALPWERLVFLDSELLCLQIA
jgi:hypothetical protein